jgi:hypothetical protein
MVKFGNPMVLKHFLFMILLVLCGSAPVHAQTSFEDFKHDVLMDAAQRHLDLGVWCRDRGLVSQATAEFYAAVEVSERTHPGALRVLGYMTSLDDRFWKKNRKHPSKSSVKSYAKKAAKARLGDRKDRVGLARLAWKRAMRAEAKAEYESILRKRDTPLQVDSKGRILVEGGTIPVELSDDFLNGAVAINGQLYLRDPFLNLLPNVQAIQQVESDLLRVRGLQSLASVADFHALGEALFPHLESALLGKPVGRLNLFVFQKHATYESYLTATKQMEYAAVAGFAQRSNLTAVVCAEDLDEDSLRSVILHELTHLFVFSMTRAVLPSWYAEGFAELFGGQGTFTWDGQELQTGGMMAAFRLEPLSKRENRFTIEELLQADAIKLFAENRQHAFHFYAQSWAFLYFLRNHADKPQRMLFATWEQRCFGTATGAEIGNLNAHDGQPATLLFRESFGADLVELELQFQTWLNDLLLP